MSNKLLEACEEFVRKVDCGEARSKRSYKQMKEAITEHYHTEALSKNNNIKKQLEDRNVKSIGITFDPEVHGNGSIDKDKLTIEVCDIMQSYLDGKFTKIDNVSKFLGENELDLEFMKSLERGDFLKDFQTTVISNNPVFVEKLKAKITKDFDQEGDPESRLRF